MRILTRYVLREFLVPLFFCFAGFASLEIMFELFGVFGRIAEAKPEAGVIVHYFLAYFAPYFQWTAPACLMLATLYTMWNFCRHSELTAMRASGIGFFAIVKPVLGVAVFALCAVYWVNEVYAPANGPWAKQFRDARFRVEEMDAADNLIYLNSEADRTWNIGNVITADAHTLENVSVTQNYPGGGRQSTIRAPRAQYLDGQWWFTRPEVRYFSQAGTETASPAPALDALTFRPFPSFTERPVDFLLQNQDLSFCAALDRLRYVRTHASLSREQRVSHLYDAWAQLFAPFACLVITLFAIPAGVATGRQSVFKGILSALGTFFAFYGLTILCQVFAKKCLLPPLFAAILPHVVFTGIGCVLFHRQR